jgi:hypothetical protein
MIPDERTYFQLRLSYVGLAGGAEPRNPCPNRNSENSRHEYSAISCFDLMRHLCTVFMWNNGFKVLFDASVLQMFVAFVER